MEIIEEEKCDEEDKMHKINIAGKDYDRNSNEKVHFVECEKSYEIFKKNTDTLEKYIQYMNNTFKGFKSNYVEFVECYHYYYESQQHYHIHFSLLIHLNKCQVHLIL